MKRNLVMWVSWVALALFCCECWLVTKLLAYGVAHGPNASKPWPFFTNLLMRWRDILLVIPIPWLGVAVCSTFRKLEPDLLLVFAALALLVAVAAGGAVAIGCTLPFCNLIEMF